MPPDHTKTTKRLTCADAYQSLPDPMLAVRNPEVILVWSTNAYHMTDLAGHRYRIVLPCLTSRGVKYTHDINCVTLHHHSGPVGLCVIHQSRHQPLEVVGDGGAKHRSIDPPTEWHSVADPHAASTIPLGGPAVLTPHSARFGRTV